MNTVTTTAAFAYTTGKYSFSELSTSYYCSTCGPAGSSSGWTAQIDEGFSFQCPKPCSAPSHTVSVLFSGAFTLSASVFYVSPGTVTADGGAYVSMWFHLTNGPLGLCTSPIVYDGQVAQTTSGTDSAVGVNTQVSQSCPALAPGTNYQLIVVVEIVTYADWVSGHGQTVNNFSNATVDFSQHPLTLTNVAVS